MNTSEILEQSLIAGIGLTYLSVYDQRPGPDDKHSGCPHVHGVSEEAYFGIDGEGYVELHDPDEGFREIPVRRGTYLQFPPDTLHRTVSVDSLRVVVIMGAGGLAERGDARIYFGEEVDNNTAEHERLTGLADQGLDGALERRDASVHAYMGLMDLRHRDPDAYRQELRRFIAVHRNTLEEFRDELWSVSTQATLHRARQAVQRVDALPGGARDAAIPVLTREYQPVSLGMCGLLRRV